MKAYKHTRALAQAVKASNGSTTSRRQLSVHEYHAMNLLQKYNVPVPECRPAFSAEEAYKAAKQFKSNELVIKAQVLAGGRGKGHFDSGLQGGVHMVNSPEEARDLAKQMIGQKLITKQTGEKGRICNAVMLAARRPPKHEYYCALLMDRTSNGPVIVASARGGMNIEDVAKEEPEAIVTTPIDYKKGLTMEPALDIAKKLGFKGDKAQKEAAKIFMSLHKLFSETDATQIEINPLAETEDGAVLCMDAKLGFDDNAEFRQAEVFKLRDASQEDSAEVEAAESGLNYIKLDGNVACLVNGAGLAMATMDVLSLHGGSPANFLDVGGTATPETVKKAFEILLRDKKVKSVLVCVFAGIVRADFVAQGIIDAMKELKLDIPLVVRLQGTKENEAKQLIKDANLKIYAFDGLDEAAAKAVELAKAS